MLNEEELDLKIEREARLFMNKEKFTIEKVFKEVAKKPHTDVYDLSAEVLKILIINDGYMHIKGLDYAKVVNEINDLISMIESNKKSNLKIEKGNKLLKLIEVTA